MTTATKRARAKLLRRPIGVTVMRAVLCDKEGQPLTGEVVGVLAPNHPIDYRSLRERKFSVGTQLRCEVQRDRNPKFWGKAHILGGWLADNVDAFHGLGMHDALKHLQIESGIGCTVESFEFDYEGETLTGRRKVADSLNFTDMDEGRFSELWDEWIEWLRRNAWPTLTPVARQEVEDLIQGDQ